MARTLRAWAIKGRKNSAHNLPYGPRTQPRSQAFSSPERKTGHVPPRFWVVTNKIIERVRFFWRKPNFFLATLG